MTTYPITDIFTLDAIPFPIAISQVIVLTTPIVTDTLQWILTDHLGSATTTANADGTWNSTIQYTAFGEIRLAKGITPTKYRYTGQLAQAEMGLDYYVARWYDPLTGHFTSADSIVPEPGKASAFDRYAYVSNNPIRFNDPTGHDVGCAGRDASECSGLNKLKTNVEKVKDVLTKIEHREKVTWNRLAESERKILSSVGWNASSFNESDWGTPGVTNIGGTVEDPAVWVSLVVSGAIKSPGLIKAILSFESADCTNDGQCTALQLIDGTFPTQISQLKHIFRDAPGHFLEDTVANRKLIMDTISPDNFKFVDEFGKQIFARNLENGLEIWVTTLRGIIQNGGVNDIPKF